MAGKQSGGNEIWIIIVTALTTLLVGGTAPWWWNDFVSGEPKPYSALLQ